jgi:hypothetical protein
MTEQGMTELDSIPGRGYERFRIQYSNQSVSTAWSGVGIGEGGLLGKRWTKLETNGSITSNDGVKHENSHFYSFRKWCLLTGRG